MTFAGWITLIVSIGSTSVVFFWCIYKVLKTPDETDHLHGFDSHTPDREG